MYGSGGKPVTMRVCAALPAWAKGRVFGRLGPEWGRSVPVPSCPTHKLSPMSWVRRPGDPTPWEKFTFSASAAGYDAPTVFIPPKSPEPGYHASGHAPLLEYLLAGTVTLVGARQTLVRFRLAQWRSGALPSRQA